MIPEGWLHIRPSKVIQLFGGGAFSSSDAQDDGIRWLKIANVGIGRVKWEDESFLPSNFRDEYSRYILQASDIVVALTRPTLNKKLKIARLTKNDGVALLNQRVAKIIYSNEVNEEFIYQLLRTDEIAYRINASLLGTDPPNLSIKVLDEFWVNLPSLPEQKKIAQILSTWDAAIETVEKLIVNSQQKKKALMQQLLTGKKRFPGFDGEWKKIELGKLLEYKQPTPFLVKSTNYSDQYATPVLTAGKTFVLGYTNESFGVYEEGLPVIIFDDFTTASKFVDFPFKAKSSAMKILTAKQGVSIKYVFEAMQMINYSVGGHQRHWISIYSNLVVNLPSIEEQQKISSALSSADQEIKTWQQELSHLKQEKKALMQQLLTGKRRVEV